MVKKIEKTLKGFLYRPKNHMYQNIRLLCQKLCRPTVDDKSIKLSKIVKNGSQIVKNENF